VRGDPHARGLTSLRAIALFEAVKGLVVLLAGSGVLFLVHRDLQNIADGLVRHFHLNPASRESRILFRAFENATPGRLRWLAAAALTYAGVRLAEAWGLWRARPWAAWLGVVTAVIYVPFEIVSFVRHPRPVPLVALVINLVVILVLAGAIRRTE
jgi:uncharacterized membrane protein (DUF2068 family)